MTSGSDVSTYITSKLHRATADPALALYFPGQGSQKAGMGKDLVQASPAARRVFETADDVLGTALSRLCFEGPGDELTRTSNAQPAILATSIAVLAAALESGAIEKRPAFMAGHSLGEYTALAAAGALSFEDALLLVRERGRLMEKAGTEQPGTMAAIVAMAEDAVEDVCRESGAEVCNYNLASQIVIGGTPEAVERACRLAKERGGRGLPLSVSGAFHTSLMKTAAAEFAAALEKAAIGEPAIPVIGNVSGRPLATAAEAASDLREQILRPVRWQQSITYMIERGVAAFVEVGPGRVLTQMLKRAAPDLIAVSIDGAAALASPANA